MNTIIPNSVTSIASGAFGGSSLTSLTIPNSVTNIEDGAFIYCNLASIKVESGNTRYDSRDNCNAIIETESNTLVLGCMNTIIPNSVTSIGSRAFFGSRLTSLTIPNSVTTIGDEAFSGCMALEEVTIGSGVTKIGNCAFEYCRGLKEIRSMITDPFTCEIGPGWLDWGPSFAVIILYVPAGTKEKYESTPAWKLFQNIVEMEASSGIVIDETNFPDENFRNWVLSRDFGQDGVLTEEEIAGVTQIRVGNKNISNLKGIEYFTGMKTLVCTHNQLTSLDLSKNTALEALWCQYNQLTSLIVSKNAPLVTLQCSSNQINEAEMGKLVESLPTISEGVFAVKSMDDANELNVIAASQVAAAKAKGWSVQAYNGSEWVEYEGSDSELAPVEEGETIDIGNEIDENTSLDGNVVGDVYYSISSGDGNYDAAEGCLVVTKPTDDSAIDGQDIFGEDFKDNYTGIVFKLAPGKGTIKVEAETQGNMVLKVKIGNNEPIEMELDGKLKVKFPYNVSEPTYVYIYGGMGAAGAKAMGANRAKSAADLLKIYGFEIVSDPSGIDAIENGQPANADAPVYNLNGQRVNIPGKGIYIKNGRKVLVK